jgi:hypothetical protein
MEVIIPLNGRSTWRFKEQNNLALKIISGSADSAGPVA